jgi:REP element-mobilizing transposase RayT
MIAYHCILGMYGFWLPNDPRGSGSDYIAVWELYRYGRATKTTSRRSVANDPHNVELRLAAKRALKFPAARLTGVQAVAVVRGFATACAEGDYTIHACAVLPDHVHLVVGSHQRKIERIVGHLRARGTQELRKTPGWDRPVWGEHGWNVYLDTPANVWRAIEYVERNPIKEGKRRQYWSIVTEFDLSRVRERRVQVERFRLGGAALRSHNKRVASERG